MEDGKAEESMKVKKETMSEFLRIIDWTYDSLVVPNYDQDTRRDASYMITR